MEFLLRALQSLGARDDTGRLIACACRKPNADILVVQPAENWAAKYLPGAFDGTREGRILLQGEMCAGAIIQRGLRTPTGPFVARFFIGIILGLVARFAFMVPSTRMVLSSSAARWKSPKQIGGLKCRPGCSTGRHALGFWQLNRMSAPRHLRRSPRCSIWR